MTDKVKVMTDLTGRMSTEDLDDSQSNNPMADEPHKPKRPFKAESKNWIYQAGLGEVDDMEVIKSLNLDPALAYNIAINKAAIDKAQALTYKSLIDQGVKPKDAKAAADKSKQETLSNIRTVEKELNKKLL